MKRFLLGFIVAVTAMVMMTTCVLAATATVNGIEWTYTVSDGKASISDVPEKPTGAITIPSSLGGYPVTSIGDSAFEWCSGLTSVTIPDSVTSIGSDAFFYCSGLKSVTIPNSVTSIGYQAFYGCSGLTSVTIGNSVTSIGVRAFSGCSGLTSITIPDSVTNIGFDAFWGCNEALYDLSTIRGVKLVDGWVVGYTEKCPAELNLTGVRGISDYAVRYCSGLTSVTIGNSVTSIGEYAFYGCSRLTSVTIGNSVTSIGGSAFSNCSGLTSITIPDSVTNIGGSAFSNCSGLTSVTIGNSVTSIGDNAFNGCSGLTSVTIPNSVTNIGGSAFYNCSGLTSVTIPDSVTSIGVRAFSGCSGLTSITIPDSVTNIGELAFYGCSRLTSVTIPNSVTNIGGRAFGGCNEALYDLETIPGVKLVDGWVVGYTKECPSELNLTGVRGIAGSAFSDCRGLTNVTIDNNVTSIGSSTFSGCSGLTSITIPDSVTSIGDSAFYDCDGLTSITIPDSVTSIGSSAFYYCSKLKEVHISDIAAWCNINFKDSSANPLQYANNLYLNGLLVEDLIVPKNMGRISDYTFYNCTSLKSVYISSGVTNIGTGAFYGCTNIVNLLVPEDIEYDFGTTVNKKIKNFSLEFGGDANWVIDRVTTSDGDGSICNEKISNNQQTYFEIIVSGAGCLTFKWKASTEHYEEDIFDFAYLSLDGINLSEYDSDMFRLSGYGIGGDTDWEMVKLDVFEPGKHILRWTYIKDNIDESNVGEDSVWVDEIKYQPYYFIGFDLNGGVGTTPQTLVEAETTTIILPTADGFTKDKHTFIGWRDGKKTYEGGSTFVVPANNVQIVAQWEANTIATPEIFSCDVTNNGTLNTEEATFTISVDDNSVDDNIDIYYTLDGSIPSRSGIKYTGPFIVNTLGDVIIKAIAFRDNYFDSPVSEFKYTRIPYSYAECLNSKILEFKSNSSSQWCRVTGDLSHDGVAALQSGKIGDNELTTIEAKVFGVGEISFWWKTSSEISRGRKYDFVSFSIDGDEKAWLGGTNDWTNIVCNINTSGEHTLSWTYQKNPSNALYDDCAWIDEVIWIADSIPELTESATKLDIEIALFDFQDRNVSNNITDLEQYLKFSEWVLSVKYPNNDSIADVISVKKSTTAWMSFALDQPKLIANEPVEGDVAIASLDAVAADGAFEFTVNINQIDVGDGAVEENLKKLFKIEGTTALGNDANFSSENVEIELAEPVNGDVKFKILPKDSPDSFFIRAKLLK